MFYGWDRLRAGTTSVFAITILLLAGAIPPTTARAAVAQLTTTQADLKSMVSATPKACMPLVHAPSDALGVNKIDDEVQVGSTMYAVGSFSSATPVDCSNDATGTALPRMNVMAFDVNTGALTSFAPQVNGEVWAVLPSASQQQLYVCGDFTSADGVAREGLAKYDLATGLLIPGFDAHLNGACSDLKYVHNHLIVMGSFTKVGSSTRVAIASIYQTTGSTDAGTGFFGATTIAKNDQGGVTKIYRGYANPAGTALVVIGNFGAVGGHKRHQIAMLSMGPSRATLAAWYNSAFDFKCTYTGGTYFNWLRDVAWSPSGSFFVVGGTGSPHANQFCDSIERFNYAPTNSNEKPTWHMYTDGDTIHSVVVTSAAVYYAGHMRYIDATGPITPAQAIPAGQPCDPHTPSMGTSASSSGGPIFHYGYNCPTKTATYRPGIGALNPATGTVLSWDPQRSRNEGAKSLYVTSAGLWVGSDGADAGCTNPGGANHDDCNGQSPLDVGGDAFFPLLTR